MIAFRCCFDVAIKLISAEAAAPQEPGAPTRSTSAWIWTWPAAAAIAASMPAAAVDDLAIEAANQDTAGGCFRLPMAQAARKNRGFTGILRVSH
jgi:hypothetical protein